MSSSIQKFLNIVNFAVLNEASPPQQIKVAFWGEYRVLDSNAHNFCNLINIREKIVFFVRCKSQFLGFLAADDLRKNFFFGHGNTQPLCCIS